MFCVNLYINKVKIMNVSGNKCSFLENAEGRLKLEPDPKLRGVTTKAIVHSASFQLLWRPVKVPAEGEYSYGKARADHFTVTVTTLHCLLYKVSAPGNWSVPKGHVPYFFPGALLNA